MTHISLLILSMAAGVAGYAGITHLMIGLARRPRDATQLVFALLCLSVTVHTLVVATLYSADSVASYVTILKYCFGLTSLASSLSLMWFVAFFTGVRPWFFLWAMSIWFTLILALHLSLPIGLLYARVDELRPVVFPWGEQVMVAYGPPHPLRPLVDLFWVVLVLFMFYAVYRQYVQGSRRSALLLGLALLLLLLSRVNDTLMIWGRINSMLTLEVAVLSLVVTMSLVLSHSITQTESKLQQYQHHLQELVQERTSALTQANHHLVQEIAERTRIDATLQRRVVELTTLKEVAQIMIRTTDLTATLQRLSEAVTALFATRFTFLLTPATPPTDLRILVGFEQGSGLLAPTAIELALREMPLASQVLTQGQALLITNIQVHRLTPVIEAFVHQQQLQSMMLIPLAFQGEVLGLLVLARDQLGQTFSPEELSLAELIASDMAAAIVNQRQYQREVAARERLTTIYQAGQAFNQASLNPEQIYSEIHHAVGGLMPAESFVLMLYDEGEEKGDWVYMADVAGRWPGGRYPLAGTFAGYMLRRNASLRIDDFSLFPQEEFAFVMFGDPPDTESGVAVLLRGSERVLGLLFVQSYAKAAYTDDDVELLELLAAHAAVALENGLRYQQAQTLAATQERTRLARDLHDAVTQTIYSASLIAEVLPVVWQRNPVEGERNLTKLRHLVRGALAEMRTLLFELRPAALLAADLNTLLQQLGDVLTGNTRILVTVTCTGDAPLPGEVKVALYRIAQEAFNNVAKHSGATQAAVTCSVAPDQVVLTIGDNGRGFDPVKVAESHMGLRIMAERAAGINATFAIETAPGHGTVVEVRWPAVKEGEQ
jgi:signal transduction histidine kinase